MHCHAKITYLIDIPCKREAVDKSVLQALKGGPQEK
jgi:hypothetical protein